MRIRSGETEYKMNKRYNSKEAISQKIESAFKINKTPLAETVYGIKPSPT